MSVLGQRGLNNSSIILKFGFPCLSGSSVSPRICSLFEVTHRNGRGTPGGKPCSWVEVWNLLCFASGMSWDSSSREMRAAWCWLCCSHGSGCLLSSWTQPLEWVSWVNITLDFHKCAKTLLKIRFSQSGWSISVSICIILFPQHPSLLTLPQSNLLHLIINSSTGVLAASSHQKLGE